MSEQAKTNGIDLEVITTAYGWSIDREGQVWGLVAGDQGYEPTGIVIPKDHLAALASLPVEKKQTRG
jgi:hypothetical protein